MSLSEEEEDDDSDIDLSEAEVAALNEFVVPDKKDDLNSLWATEEGNKLYTPGDCEVISISSDDNLSNDNIVHEKSKNDSTNKDLTVNHGKLSESQNLHTKDINEGKKYSNDNINPMPTSDMNESKNNSNDNINPMSETDINESKNNSNDNINPMSTSDINESKNNSNDNINSIPLIDVNTMQIITNVNVNKRKQNSDSAKNAKKSIRKLQDYKSQLGVVFLIIGYAGIPENASTKPIKGIYGLYPRVSTKLLGIGQGSKMIQLFKKKLNVLKQKLQTSKQQQETIFKHGWHKTISVSEEKKCGSIDYDSKTMCFSHTVLERKMYSIHIHELCIIFTGGNEVSFIFIFVFF